MMLGLYLWIYQTKIMQNVQMLVLKNDIKASYIKTGLIITSDIDEISQWKRTEVQIEEHMQEKYHIMQLSREGVWTIGDADLTAKKKLLFRILAEGIENLWRVYFRSI